MVFASMIISISIKKLNTYKQIWISDRHLLLGKSMFSPPKICHDHIMTIYDDVSIVTYYTSMYLSSLNSCHKYKTCMQITYPNTNLEKILMYL